MTAGRERTASDEHLARALAALAAVGIRELEAAAAALEKREDGLRAFAEVFRQVAEARAGGYKSSFARWNLLDAIRGMDDELAGRLEGATAPFWAAVLEARAELDEGG
jgi:hypothetical protein